MISGGMKREMIASAALAAATGAASLTVLALYLNPGLTLRTAGAGLVLSLLLPWSVVGAAALALLALAAAGLRGLTNPAPPVAEGRPLFIPLATVALVAAAALYWHNLASYRHSIPVHDLRRLEASAAAVSVAALVLATLLLLHHLSPRRAAVATPLATLAAASAVFVPLALRPTAAPEAVPAAVHLDAMRPARRILLIGMDGLDPAAVQAGAGTDHVPSLARLARRGAFGALATLRPTEAPPIWTTILTGRLPRDHGIKSFSTYRLAGSAQAFELLPKGALVGGLERLGLVSRRPITSAARRRRALWNIANAFSLSTGLVRIWGTHPPEKVRGFVLSPYFHLLREDPARAEEALYPADLLAEVSARAVEARELEGRLLAELAEGASGARSLLEDPEIAGLAERAIAPDLTYRRAATVLRAAYDPAFFALAFHGYDVAGHSFYRYAQPEAFGDVTPDEARRYGRVLDRYRSLLGRWVSELDETLRPGEVLVVLSGYGLEPTPLWRRLLAALTGAASPGATHAAAPEGFLLAVGDGIRPGSSLRAASVLDVAPTLLYLMGLPVARDMEGRVLTEIIDEELARANPLTFIPSYESLAVTPVAAEPVPEELPPLPEEVP
jgi:hypothetical protein